MAIQGDFLDICLKNSENLDVLGKNYLHILIQLKKKHQNDELFILVFEKKVYKMQACDIRYEDTL